VPPPLFQHPDPELSFVKRQGVMLMCMSLAAAAYMARLQIPSHFSVDTLREYEEIMSNV